MELTIANGWKSVGKPPNVPGMPPFPGDARCYQKEAADGHLTVFVTRDMGAWHLSISHRTSRVMDPVTGRPMPGRIPTWEEIKEARYLFLPDEVYMAMLLPPKAEYVNLHPTTMHLWEIPCKAVLGEVE